MRRRTKKKRNEKHAEEQPAEQETYDISIGTESSSKEEQIQE